MDKPHNIPISTIITGIKQTELENLKNWGHYLAESNEKLSSLSSSQLRKFFGALKKIQADFINLKSEIILLDPKLAYAVGRDTNKKKTKIKEFYDQLKPLLAEIREDKKHFKHFIDVFEAIVAYHKERESALEKHKANENTD